MKKATINYKTCVACYKVKLLHPRRKVIGEKPEMKALNNNGYSFKFAFSVKDILLNSSQMSQRRKDIVLSYSLQSRVHRNGIFERLQTVEVPQRSSSDISNVYIVLKHCKGKPHFTCHVCS